MSAFITNFQSPVEMQDLEDRFRRGGISNLNMLLHWRQFQPLEWTVDKQAVVGDTVLLTILDVFTLKSEKPGRKAAL